MGGSPLKLPRDLQQLEDHELRHQWLHTLCCLLIVLSITACGRKEPIEVYRGMLAATEVGYEDGFVEGFSKRSQGVVRALVRLANAYGLDEQNPWTLISGDDAIDKEFIADIALVRIKRGTNSKYQVLFVEDPDNEDAWRIDLDEFERFIDMGRQGYLKERRRQQVKEKAAKRRGESP